MNAGRAIKIDNGIYQLRYKRDGKRVWEPVGTEADVALVRLRKKIREFEDAELGHSTAPAPTHQPTPPPTGPQKRLLIGCISKYLTEIKEHRERKTYAAYGSGLLSFAGHLLGSPNLTLESLDKVTSTMRIEDLTEAMR